MGLFSSLFGGKKTNTEESELDKLTSEAVGDPEIAAKIHQLAALMRMKDIHSLYVSGDSMAPISMEEQQAHIIMLDFMKNNPSNSGDEDMFNDFLHKVKTVHFKGNSILDSYLRSL
jgi:hypothetical protein